MQTTLKRNHLRRNIIISLIAILLLSVVVLNFTRIKYGGSSLIEEKRNYTPYNGEAIAMYQQNDSGEYVEIESMPGEGYTINEEMSYCTLDNKTKDEDAVLYTNANGEHVISGLKKESKCYLWFDASAPTSNVQILATINGSASNSFPSENSNYTPDSVTCTNGAEAKFDYKDWTVEVDSVEDTTCTVNFVDNYNETFANYLISKSCSSTPTSDEAAKNCLVNENGYRYEGSNPNNYVLFNDELWRVIGVFNIQTESNGTQNLVKLIRNETLDGLAWHGSNTNDWSASTLQSQLNNGYLNATDTTCNVYSTNATKTCYFSETGLNSTARNMVESVVWKLGGTSSTSATAATFYSAERGTTTWTGKVGLMYPSDYGYAVLASSCARTTNLGRYNTTACAGNNWLKSDATQWTLTPRSSNSSFVFYVFYDGNLNSYSARSGYGARPSIYLKSNIAVLGGDGTIDMPYRIE